MKAHPVKKFRIFVVVLSAITAISVTEGTQTPKCFTADFSSFLRAQFNVRFDID